MPPTRCSPTVLVAARRVIAWLLALLVLATFPRPLNAQRPVQSPVRGPVRLLVARLTHGHVGWILGRADSGDVRVVGIYEPDSAVVARYARRFGFDRKIVYTDLGAALDAVKPEAVVAFGAISEHRAVVEAAAPRGVHVMVEKPLAFRVDDAERIAALARRYNVHVLTNYETTWYPSGYAAWALVGADSIGPIRKVVVRDGHFGPKEIGVQPEFLAWLTDPAQNGAGALVDFGCYGANLMTWLMRGEAPTTVTAVTQQLKHGDPTYARVDDEATLVLTYPDAQAIVQGSWNWPDHRKDLEVYGTRGYVATPDGRTVRMRLRGETAERDVPTQTLPPHHRDGFAYLAAVVRGTERVADADRSSLANNLTVVRILDAARRSAREGRTIRLTP